MTNLTARDTLDLARMMIRAAQLLKSQGELAEARSLARRAIALDEQGWRLREAHAVGA